MSEKREKLVKLIGKMGIIYFMKISGLSFDRTLTLLGNENISIDLILNFIREVEREFGPITMDDETFRYIILNETNEELKFFKFYSDKKAKISVINKNNKEEIGTFFIPYEILNYGKLREIFELFGDYFEDNVKKWM